MQRRILVFLALSALALSVVPVANVLRARDNPPARWLDRGFLFNVDMLHAAASRALLPLGISTSPDEVVIGRDGWLFLGDKHQSSLSVDRTPQSDHDVEVARQVATAMTAWEAYAAARGVRAFRVMFAPNKGTVYPARMPRWAQPASPSGFDALFDVPGRAPFVDLRPALRAASVRSGHPLYYPSDTHWNFLGAGVGFRAFAESVAPAMPDVRWPGPADYAVVRTDRREGGDLARFLRIPGAFDDAEPIIGALTRPIATVQVDLASGRVLARVGNPMVETPVQPLLVRSPGALNRAKVLWVRDSFGQALSPLMAATFSDVVQVSTATALGPDVPLARLIDEWRPDYVIFTVVERLSREPQMMRLPPGGAATARR